MNHATEVEASTRRMQPKLRHRHVAHNRSCVIATSHATEAAAFTYSASAVEATDMYPEGVEILRTTVLQEHTPTQKRQTQIVKTQFMLTA